jgi:carboxymethylenebutenolidase
MEHTGIISLQVADGTVMNAYYSRPQQPGKYPGIVLFQEAFGVNAHIRSVADRLAAEQYVVIAPEVFHRTAAPGEEFAYNNFPSVMPHYQALTNEGMIEDAKACFEWLQQQEDVVAEKIGNIGFCLGGKVSFVANSALPFSASVSFYGGGTHLVADRASQLHAPQLLFWAGKDAHIMPEHVQTVTEALRAAGKEFVNVEFSNAPHAFFCDARPAYHAESAKEAWDLTKSFLKDKLNKN